VIVLCAAVGATITGSAAAASSHTHATGILRFGDSYKAASGYDRYDTVLVGYGDVDAAAKLSARSLVYKGGVDVYDSPNADAGFNGGGVPYRQAASNGWLLRDATGNPLKAAGFGNWLGDVGNPGFQKAWAKNVSTFLLAHHADGVFVDNVLCSITGLDGGTAPSAYPTDAAWANAYISFLSYVGVALHAKGLYVSANAYCYGAPDMSANIAWWKRVAPHVDGLMNEMFEQSPNDKAERYFDAPHVSWMGNWAANLKLIETAQQLGKDALALTYGANSDTSLMTYARASFLLAWDGGGSTFFWSPTDGPDPWATPWTADIGKPAGAMVKRGAVYTRAYAGGYVVVNPSLSAATTSLPGGLVTLSGAAAGTTVTLAPKSAAIFRRR
jgi:hypothetical protein